MKNFIKYLIINVIIFLSYSVNAERIENKIAVFNTLEKISTIIKIIEIKLNETKKFGFLEITPRICYSRTSTERPKTTAFIEINEISINKIKIKRIFTGWMFVNNSGISGIEHPIYDVWLIGCKKK